MKKSLQLSVTDFALPCPRVGSLEIYSGYGMMAQIGSEIHDWIQTERSRENVRYNAEKQMSQTFEREGRKFTIGGRIDSYGYFHWL